MYRLIFTPQDGKARYKICAQALWLAQKPTPTSEWDDMISLTRNLKDIGKPTGEEVNGVKLYELRDGGGEIGIENSAHRLLLDYINQPIWRGQILESVRETLSWLASLNPEPSTPKLT